MATISELTQVKSWQLGRTIATTPEGIRIGHCGGSIRAIKMLRAETSQEERKQLLERCKEVAREYFLKVFEVEKRELWWRSDLYDCDFCFEASEDDALTSDEAIIYMVMCPYPGLIFWPTRLEKDLKRTFPFGYECFKLLVQYDITAIYKLREYTRKVLQQSFGVKYRDFDIKKGLFSSELGDLPEDFFMNRLIEILSWFWDDNGHEFVRWEILEELQKLPVRVKEDLRYWRKKCAKEDPIGQSGSELRPTDILVTDAFAIVQIEEAYKLLTPREKAVCVARLIKGWTLKEIGQFLGGITPQAVKKIETAGLKKLKRDHKVKS